MSPLRHLSKNARYSLLMDVFDDAPLGTPTAAGTVSRLFREHASRIRRLLARRLRSIEDGQDASQELFLRLWRQEREGHLRDDALAYMHSAAQSVAVDHVRRRQSRGGDRDVEIELDELEQPDAPTDEKLHWREGIETLVSGLQELPLVVQQVFILYHFEALSHIAIAKKLGISVRSVERHMSRAIGHCRERLKEYL